MVMAIKKLLVTKECTSDATRFDGRAGVPVQCHVLGPIEVAQGFVRSHWKPPLDEYSHGITLEDWQTMSSHAKKL